MDLLDRYLQAVKFFLPRHQQDDILSELSENLISQMEDREQALGRPLEEAEQAEILRRHGHPMIVAGRYRSRQHLIGPVFFPIYLFALNVGLGGALLVTVVLAAIAAALHGDPIGQAVQAMLDFPGRALMVFAWTTLGFAALDFVQASLGVRADWDPRTLPRLVKPELRISPRRALCELAFAVAVLIWLLLVPQAPHLLLGPAAAFAEAGPALRFAYVPAVLLAVATAVLHAVNLMRPYWTKARSLARLAIEGATLVVVALLLRANHWFVPVSPRGPLPAGVDVDRVVEVINAGFQIGFFFVFLMTAIEIVREAYRFRNRRHASPSSHSAAARA